MPRRSEKKKPNANRTKQRPRRQPRAERIESVSFVSLGCPKNLVDSEKMLGLLAEDGLIIVSADAQTGSEEPEIDAAAPDGPRDNRGADQTDVGGGADVVVINTCGFLEASKDESLSVIRRAIREKELGKVKRVVVTGCLVQRHRARMLDWAPGIDAMVGVFDRDMVIEAVRGDRRARHGLNASSDGPKYWISGNALQAARARGRSTTGLTVNGKDGRGIGYFEDDSARLRLTPRHYAYLRVSEGCNQNCAFCTIPSIRGKMRSKPLDRVAAEAVELIADGAFELNLIGQDTTSYGDDLGIGYGADQRDGGLVSLLRTVNGAFDRAGVRDGWVRLMYAYPSNFADGMIDAIAELSVFSKDGGRGPGRVVPYIDIPLQHASDRVLGAMRRNVSAARQADLMHRLRERIPGISIRTTFISGFPGETEADHRKLLAFVRTVGFDAVGVFEYSHEPGTVAGTMENDESLAVPPEVKARRRAEIMALQQQLAFEKSRELAARFKPDQASRTGARFDVLIDGAAGVTAQPTTGVGRGGRLYRGRTYAQAPQVDALTFVQSARELSPGELVPCVVVDADGYDLIARPVDELERRVGLSVLRSARR